MKLEPLDFTCRYCKNNKADNNNYLKTLVKPIVRTISNLVEYESHKFINLLIPRCKYCYYVHLGSKIFSWIFCILLLLIITSFSFLKLSHTGFVLTILITVVPVTFYVNFLSDMIVKTKNIPSDLQGLADEPIIEELYKEGWEIYVHIIY